MKRTVNVMFRSEFWGQGKTVAALSYSRPGLEQPRRLLVDMEYRDMSYKSPDDVDHPEQLLFAYDFFQDEYNHGDVTQDAITRLYTEIMEDKFPYDVLIFDNVALFQEELYVLLSDKKTAVAVAKTVRGVYERNRLFLDYKFKPTDPGQHHIQQDQVIFGSLKKLKCTIATVLHIDTVILQFKRVLEHGAQFKVVLDQQYAGILVGHSFFLICLFSF